MSDPVCEYTIERRVIEEIITKHKGKAEDVRNEIEEILYAYLERGIDDGLEQ